jgi:uncharacterized delta-60 repeat protein
MDRTPRRATIAAITAAVLALVAGQASAAPTDLDRGFGTGGRATVGFDGVDDTADDTALTPDGGLIGVGSTRKTYTGYAFRLDAAGKIDASFGINGIRLLDGKGGGWANAVAVQADGKIVVAGYAQQGQDVAVWRLTPAGRLDPSFNGNGLTTINSGGVEYATDVEIQVDGKIVVAGRTSLGEDGAIYRLNPNGSLDTSFDQDGAIGIDSGGGESIAALAIQPDGKIVAAGYTSAGHAAAVYRINANGSLDTSFDDDGAVGIAVGGYALADDVAIQPDGKILVAGAGNYDALVARLRPDGSFDESFGAAGLVTVDAGDGEGAERIALLPDGRILAAGHTSAGDDALLVRLNADGSRDTTFAPDGFLAFGGSGFTRATAMSLQPDGKFVLAGESAADDSDALVYRFLGESRPSAGSGGPAGPGATASCAGRRATIVGTRGRDRLRGTRGRDVIAGLGGADVIHGLGGNDLICGSGGNDRITGGAGRDVLFGGAGRDRLFGGAGRDRLVGGAGRNLLRQ